MALVNFHSLNHHQSMIILYPFFGQMLLVNRMVIPKVVLKYDNKLPITIASIKYGKRDFPGKGSAIKNYTFLIIYIIFQDAIKRIIYNKSFRYITL